MGFREVDRGRSIGGGRSARGPVFAFDPLGPERVARHARAAFEAQELERAVELYGRAVGCLHDHYVLGSFRARQPSADDAVVVDGLVAALEALRRQTPGADGATVARLGQDQLGEMTTAADAAGLDAGHLRRAARRLAGAEEPPPTDP